MKLSEGVEAAIHSTAMLAAIEHGATMPASALAEAFGLSPSYLLKHLQIIYLHLLYLYLVHLSHHLVVELYLLQH